LNGGKLRLSASTHWFVSSERQVEGGLICHRLSWNFDKGSRMERDAISDSSPERRFRTLFISDVHLGARGSQADRLLDFLRCHDADTIYLVGDIIDGWALKSNWHWPQSHNDFVQKMLRRVRKGAKVIYIPGNHDEFLRSYYGTHFGGVEVVETAIHEGADGKNISSFTATFSISSYRTRAGSRISAIVPTISRSR
jgi:predicted MPP superfamily phosphohydrolase